MCGIVGYWDKSGSADTPLGGTLLGMITALGCRGPDSTGVAAYQAKDPATWVARVKLGDSGELEARAAQVVHSATPAGARDFSRIDACLRFTLDPPQDAKAFLQSIESIAPDVEVVSLGNSLEIVKQVGSPANLESTFAVSHFRGSHGIAHTRLSTESVVDLSHSQPFWAHARHDLAIVHNGHITNYHQLRRRYQQQGVRFYTENDSEIVAIYLARRLKQGDDLEGALMHMLSDLDGSYSCLAATESEFGFVRDPFALKPLCFAETGDFVAIATEEIAIRAACQGDYRVRETQAKEVRVWQR